MRYDKKNAQKEISTNAIGLERENEKKPNAKRKEELDKILVKCGIAKSCVFYNYFY